MNIKEYITQCSNNTTQSLYLVIMLQETQYPNATILYHQYNNKIHTKLFNKIVVQSPNSFIIFFLYTR